MAERMDWMPLGPLEDIAWRKSGLPRYEKPGGESVATFNDQVFAAMVGVSGRTICRWRADSGRVPWVSADVCATALGEHPVRIWGERWLDLDRDVIEGTAPRSVMLAISRAEKAIDALMAEAKEEAQDEFEPAFARTA